jgi:hypothetical protein
MKEDFQAMRDYRAETRRNKTIEGINALIENGICYEEVTGGIFKIGNVQYYPASGKYQANGKINLATPLSFISWIKNNRPECVKGPDQKKHILRKIKKLQTEIKQLESLKEAAL